VTALGLVLASYFLGAIPSSYLVGRLVRGIDLRQYGSGNLGATNAFRVLGWQAALPVLLFDVFKGWFPTHFFPLWDGGASPYWVVAYAAAAVIGHVFSVYVRFRGGKGVATSAGVLLALAPRGVLAGLLVWLLVIAISRIVSLASILAALTVPIVVWAAGGPAALGWLCTALAAFVILAHRSNIRRLLRHEEPRLGTPRGVAP
jgi:acyl phosphate:glycerol-3-phosphate acyltransferase